MAIQRFGDFVKEQKNNKVVLPTATSQISVKKFGDFVKENNFKVQGIDEDYKPAKTISQNTNNKTGFWDNFKKYSTFGLDQAVALDTYVKKPAYTNETNVVDDTYNGDTNPIINQWNPNINEWKTQKANLEKELKGINNKNVQPTGLNDLYNNNINNQLYNSETLLRKKQINEQLKDLDDKINYYSVDVDGKGKIKLRDSQIEELAKEYNMNKQYYTKEQQEEFDKKVEMLSEDSKNKILKQTNADYIVEQEKLKKYLKNAKDGVYWANDSGANLETIAEELKKDNLLNEDNLMKVYEASNNYGLSKVTDAEKAVAKVFDVIDSTGGGAYRGYYNAINDRTLGELILVGKIEEAEKYMLDHEYISPEYEKGAISNAIHDAFQLVGQMGSQFTNWKTGTAAVIGFLIGTATTKTTTGGAKGAQIAANIVASGEGGLTETGSSYRELRENGIDEELARKVALGVGTINAGLEYMQLNKLESLLKGNALTGSTREVVAKYLADVASNAVQEVAQEAVTLTGTEIAKVMQNPSGDTKQDIVNVLQNVLSDESKKRLWNTGVSSAISFAIIGVPGLANSSLSSAQIQQYRDDIYTLKSAGVSKDGVHEILERMGSLNDTTNEVVEEVYENNEKISEETIDINNNNNNKINDDLTSQNTNVEQNINQDNINTQEELNNAEIVLNELQTRREKATNEAQQKKLDTQIANLEVKIEELNKIIKDNSKQKLDSYKSINFDKDYEKFKSGKYTSNDVITFLDSTPEYFYNMGFDTNKSVTMNMMKLNAVMKEKQINSNSFNQHGITQDIVEQIPYAISNPLNVVKNPKFNNRFVVVTELSDKYGDIVIVPIEIDTSGSTNKIITIYGKEQYDGNDNNPNIGGYMVQNKNNIVYDIDKNPQKKSYSLEAPIAERNNSFIGNNSTTKSSKSQMSGVLPTNSNMQKKEKNAKVSADNIKKNNRNIMSAMKEEMVIKADAEKIAKQLNNTKQRSWVETSTESDVLKDKVLIKDLDTNKINYLPQSNKKSLDLANAELDRIGYENAIEEVRQMMDGKEAKHLPRAEDIALAERLLQEAAKKGDTGLVQELVMDISIMGTDLGKATQALSIIQKLTPEGQLKMYETLVKRAKARGEKSFNNVEITPEMVEKVLKVYKGDGTFDQVELNQAVEEFKQDIANQMKATIGDKVDAWRYLSMLGNPKTHIRNMVSNVAMTGTIKVKNAMARTLETILPIKDRTKTWKKSSEFIKQYSKDTANEMKGIITGENKYNEKSSIESKKQIFKNKALEKISDFNSNALEAEDWFFSKRAFQSTLEEYLTAKGIRTEEDIKNNPELIQKAKNYAVEQAEIATFRQYSKLASTINQIEKKNKGARLAVQALMPFKKTPINVAKAGISYSPLGLIKSLSYDAYQLKQGNINASQFIDNLSQGLTGTSLTLLGYALAKAGLLSGGGDDDKESKYDSQLGNTGYSLKIGGNSYSISWLSPVAMPLLVGASAYEQLEEGKEWNMNVVSDSLAKTLDPLNEMSFMQGVTNALNSYSSGVDKWKGVGESTLQNYVGQFFPTLFSQLASTIDDKKRSTKASNNSSYKFGEQTLRSIMYKVPGLRQKLEVATDIWGNEKEQSENIIERAFESFIAPYSKTKNISSDLDKEIKKVYDATGKTEVIPSVPYAYTKYQNETYKMSASEYTQYKKTYGTTASTTLNQLFNSNSYKNASSEDKAKMIDNVYDYARAKANDEYFKNVPDVSYENKILDKINTLKKNYGINAGTYYANKDEYDYAYKYPSKYSAITQITTYSKYQQYKDKIKDIKDNTKNDKVEVINYINSLNLSIPQKAMFIRQYYTSFNQYNQQIIDYINGQKMSVKEKTEILEELGFKVNEGRVYW